jgi:DNA repair exonuclease SbcCD ATPase subunit
MESIMVDPTGTAGVIKESSLDLAVKGGPKFMARLQQLGDAADRHDAAYAKLGIGDSAVSVFNNAQQKLAEAERKVAEADALRAQAAKTLSEAQANAKANAKAQAVEADKIVALQRQVEKHLKQAEAREQAATEAIAKAERAQADATRLREDLQGKTDSLLASMREIAAA